MKNNSYESFKKAVLDIAVESIPGRQADDFDEHDHPVLDRPFFSLTFFLFEGAHVDHFIQSVRDRLLESTPNEKSKAGAYVYHVWKSHILSHGYWSVSFWLADKYEYIEDSQP